MAINTERLGRARAWADYNYAPTRPLPPPPPQPTGEADAERLKALRRLATPTTNVTPTEPADAPRQRLGDNQQRTLSIIRAAGGFTSETSDLLTGPAVVNHLFISSDVPSDLANLTNGAVVVATPNMATSLTTLDLLAEGIPLVGSRFDFSRCTFAPGPAGASMTLYPKVIIPWATFRFTLAVQMGVGVTVYATTCITFQTVGADIFIPPLDYFIPVSPRLPTPRPPAPRTPTLTAPVTMRVSGPGFSRLIPWEFLDPVLQQEYLVNQLNGKATPGLQAI